MKPIVLRMLSLLLVSLLLAACAAPTDRVVQTPEQMSRVTRTPASAGTARPQPTSTTAASDVLTLTWWTPEFISPKAPAPAGPLLAKQLADFEAMNDGKVRVNPVLKARYGKGGLLDFLRTTQPVASGLLPDIVALDVAELEQAVNMGVLQPLDSTLSRTITPTLYAFARQTGQFDGRTMAIPYIADVEHAIYNRDRMSQPPNTWTGILAEKTPYLFPAGSPQPSSAAALTEGAQHAVVSQYLSAGGTVDPKTLRLVLQEQPLLRLLNFYSRSRAMRACCRKKPLIPPVWMRLGLAMPRAARRWPTSARGATWPIGMHCRTQPLRRLPAGRIPCRPSPMAGPWRSPPPIPCARRPPPSSSHGLWRRNALARGLKPRAGCPLRRPLWKPGARPPTTNFSTANWLRLSHRQPGRTTPQPLPACKKP